jgi:DNA-binding transcriptional MerR regulator
MSNYDIESVIELIKKRASDENIQRCYHLDLEDELPLRTIHILRSLGFSIFHCCESAREEPLLNKRSSDSLYHAISWSDPDHVSILAPKHHLTAIDACALSGRSLEKRLQYVFHKIEERARSDSGNRFMLTISSEVKFSGDVMIALVELGYKVKSEAGPFDDQYCDHVINWRDPRAIGVYPAVYPRLGKESVFSTDLLSASKAFELASGSGGVSDSEGDGK